MRNIERSLKVSTFKPKFFTCMKNYSLSQFYKDITAGVIVAIIALPLSIALAIASGVSPEKGLHTAIIAGFFISFLGGSRVQIGGPTGAFMVIVSGIIAEHGLEGLIISTILAGVILVLMGVFRLGSIIKFIPYPITTGFTSGIALVIFSTQIKDFFGLSIEEVPSEFIEKWESYILNINKINWTSVLLGVAALLIIIYWPKVNRKIPGSLVALIVTTLIAYFFKLDVDTIGSKYGELSSALPMPKLPNISIATVKKLLQPAFTIALLGGIESLLSAVVADGMIGGKHRSNTELIAQGAANIASGLFGGIPATGAIARTAANVKNGGRTPVAGMVHALVLLLIMVLFMPYAKLIPLTSLAAILMVVAYNMSEWRAFKSLLSAPKSDIFVLLATFALTVLIDLVVAIEIGMVLAALLFMKRMADVTQVQYVSMDLDDVDSDTPLRDTVSKDVLVYEINGPFFFGAADKFAEVIEQVQGPAKVLILKMNLVPAMDATAIHAMNKLRKTCKASKTKLILTGVKAQPYSALEKAGFIDKLGEGAVFESLEEALEKAS
ncbi:sulfate permease [Clostridium thermarum]|uniref:SulP family inorganic anion transporter n=1 Tax=Clostridium thermarum TaxID=1716543 RepID=UPI001122FAF2